MPEMPISNVAGNMAAQLSLPAGTALGGGVGLAPRGFAPGGASPGGTPLPDLAGVSPGPITTGGTTAAAGMAGGAGPLAGLLGALPQARQQQFQTNWQGLDTAPMADQLGFFANLMGGGNDAFSKIIEAIAARGGGAAGGAVSGA